MRRSTKPRCKEANVFWVLVRDDCYHHELQVVMTLALADGIVHQFRHVHWRVAIHATPESTEHYTVMVCGNGMSIGA